MGGKQPVWLKIQILKIFGDVRGEHIWCCKGESVIQSYFCDTELYCQVYKIAGLGKVEDQQDHRIIES